MTPPVKVSAVIPVYNGQAYVAEAIQSVLDQTLPPIECLVIDDGSADSTAEIVRRFGAQVTYVRQDRQGVAVARNHGATLARGEFVAFLDHDDVWTPAKLERQLQLLANDNPAMILCALNVVDSNGTFVRTARLRARDDLITGMLMFDGTETVSCSSTGLVRRSALVASGGFDVALSMSADWDLLLRMLLSGGVAYVDEPLVAYRVHGTNMSRNIAAMERDMSFAFAKAFADPRLPLRLQQSKRHAYGRLYRMLAGSYLQSGNRRAALGALAISFRYDRAVARELIDIGRRRRRWRA